MALRTIKNNAGLKALIRLFPFVYVVLSIVPNMTNVQNLPPQAPLDVKTIVD